MNTFDAHRHGGRSSSSESDALVLRTTRERSSRSDGDPRWPLTTRHSRRRWSLARDRIVPLEGTHGRSIGGGCCLTPSNRKPRERCPRDRGGGRAPPRSASLSPCALFLPRLIHSHCSRPHLHHILYPIRKEKGNFDTTVVAFRPPRTGNRCDRGCFSSPLLSPSLPLLSPSLPFSPLHSTPRHSVSRFPHLTPSSAHGLPSGIYIYVYKRYLCDTYMLLNPPCRQPTMVGVPGPHPPLPRPRPRPRRPPRGRVVPVGQARRFHDSPAAALAPRARHAHPVRW